MSGEQIAEEAALAAEGDALDRPQVDVSKIVNRMYGPGFGVLVAGESKPYFVEDSDALSNLKASLNKDRQVYFIFKLWPTDAEAFVDFIKEN